MNATAVKSTKYVPLTPKIRDMQIKMFYLEDSDTCYKLLEEAAIALACVGVAAELDPKMRTSEAEKKLDSVRKAISVCQALINTDMWDTNLHKEIDDGMEAARWLEKRTSEVYKLTAQFTKAMNEEHKSIS